MPSAIVGALKVILSADTAEYNSKMTAAGKEAAKLSRDFAQVGRQMTQVGSVLTKAITLPLLAVGAGAVKVGSDFESSFAGIRKTVGDATDAMGELTPVGRALQQGMRDLAKEIPVSVDELNRIGEAAGQLGIKSANIIDFTRVMANLSATTSLSSEEAATSLAQLANITQMPQEQFDRLGATIVGLGNNFATNETKIVDFGLRIAGAGKLAGLSEHQILAIGTAMASIGVEAEAGGTAVQKVLNDMTEAVATGNKSLAIFAQTAGMSAQDFATMFRRDAAGAFAEFVSGLGIQGDRAFGTLNALGLGNERVVRAFLSLGNAGDLLNRTLEEGARSWQQNTALAKEAEQRYRTFESQMKLLWNQVRDVGIELGLALLPAMKSLVTVAQTLVPVLELLVRGFTALPTWVQVGVVAFAGFAAALGPAIWALGQLITSVGTVIGAFKAKGIATRALNAIMSSSIVTSTGLATALRGVTAALGPLAAAITAVWAAWKIGNTETVKNAIAEWGLSSHNATAYLYRLIAGVERMTPEQAKAAVAATAAAESAQKQATAINAVTEAAVDFVGPIEDATAHNARLVSGMDEADKKAKAFAESLRELGGTAALAGAREVVDQLHALNGPLNVLPSKLAEMAARLREGAEAALLAGKADLANQYTKLADTLDPIIQFQQRYNVTIGEYVTMAPQAASWTEELNDQLHRLGGTVTTIGPVLQSSLDLSKMFAPLKGSIKQNLPNASAWADAWSSMKDGLKDALGNIPGTLAQAFTGGGDIMGAIKSVVSQVGSAIGSSLGFMFGGPLGQKIGSAIGSLAGLLVNPFKKLFGIGKNDEIKKFNAEIDKSREKLIEQYGSLERIDKLGRAVGVDLAGAWYHQGEAGKKAFDKIAKEFEDAVSKMESDLEGFQSDLESAFDEAKNIGYIFDRNGELVSVSFEKMQDVANEFGVDLQALGPAFQGQRIAADAAKIVNAFELLSKGGTDAGTILFGLKDEISALVQQSMKFGTTIPEQMRPWILNLIETGQLIDENGEKITDIGQIKFGAAIETQFEAISRKISDLIDRIGQLIDTLAAIPTQKDITITTHHENVGGGGGEENGGYEVPQFAVGTMGRMGRWFGNFGAGQLAQLDGVEAVITQGQAVPFAMDMLAGLARPQGQQATGAQQPVTVRSVIENRILLDGHEVKNWLMERTTTAIENNERGIRSRMRDALGVPAT